MDSKSLAAHPALHALFVAVVLLSILLQFVLPDVAQVFDEEENQDVIFVIGWV
jgi:type II secretory pathway component PulF